MTDPTTETSPQVAAAETSAVECILRTHDLTLRYGTNLAVDRLGLNVQRGGILDILRRQAKQHGRTTFFSGTDLIDQRFSAAVLVDRKEAAFERLVDRSIGWWCVKIKFSGC